MEPVSLVYPFEGQMHPAPARADQTTHDWLVATGLIADRARDMKVRAARFGWLAARAYPWASADGLQLASDWTTWLFMRDDMCDEAGLRYQPHYMKEHCDILLRVLLEGASGGDAADPLICALADMRERMLQLGGHAWLASFTGPVRDYFDACVWEAANRQNGMIPDIPHYIRMRRYTGGVLTCLALVEITDGLRLTLQAKQDPTVMRLVEIANDVICWSNDVLSAPKELREHDFHNLCIVIKHALRCELDSAMRCVVQMHNDRVAEFMRLQTSSALDTDPTVVRFIAVLKAWMRANYDWSVESGRYKQSAESPLVIPDRLEGELAEDTEHAEVP